MSKQLRAELTKLMRDQLTVESINPCVQISTGVLAAMVDPAEFGGLVEAAIDAAETTGDADVVEALGAVLAAAQAVEEVAPV